MAALQRAEQYSDEEGYPRWTWAWLSGDINRQQGRLTEAIVNLRSVLEDRTADMQQARLRLQLRLRGDQPARADAVRPGPAAGTAGPGGRGATGLAGSGRRVRANARDRFRKRDGTSQSAALVCRAGRRRTSRASTSSCICVTSRTTTPKAAPSDWLANGIRPPITRPKPS